MYTDNEYPRQAGGRPRFAGRFHDDPGNGPWGGPPRGPWSGPRRGRLLPLLALAFVARAALRQSRFEGGPRRHGHGHGHGPWGWGDWQQPHTHEDRGERRGDRGDRGGYGRRGGGRGRGIGRALWPEIGALVALLRGGLYGGVNERQLGEIKAVIGDARKRIAAILAESGVQSPRDTGGTI